MVPEIIIGSKISLGRLSQADQDLVKQAAFDAIDFQRAEWAAYVQLSMDKVKAAGCTIIPIPDKTEWMKAVDPMYKKQPKEIQDLVARIRAVK
jgi:TRAP-type C4-dicarboxylate transport system substrate-binding protein